VEYESKTHSLQDELDSLINPDGSPIENYADISFNRYFTSSIPGAPGYWQENYSILKGDALEETEFKDIVKRELGYHRSAPGVKHSLT
jgi:hypothetical protein